MYKINFKAISVMLAALSVSSINQALPNGFYAGAGFGGITFHDKLSGSGTTTFSDDSFTSGSSTTNAGSDIEWNSMAFAGYAWSLPHQLFLSTEVFGNLMNASIYNSGAETISQVDAYHVSSEGSGDYTLKNAFGARILPGYQIKPDVAIYGILGYARAHIDINNNAGSLTVDSNTANIPSSSSNYNTNGYQLGLGSMINVTEHIFIRGDVIYTGCQNIDSHSTVTESDSVTTGSSTLQFSTLEADLSVGYQF